MLEQHQLYDLQVRAHRWWDWAAGIRAASELESAKPHVTGHVALLDTSEIVEYARPSSLLRNEYPTRLDLSLDLIFAPHEPVFMTGAHAKEVQGVSVGWHEDVSQALAELKIVRRRFDDVPADVKKDLEDIGRNIRAAAEQLVRLLRENYQWLFSESKIRPANFFDKLLSRLEIPSGKALGLPAEWQYHPDYERVEAWRKRLHHTVLGSREPGPNLIDALALDQIDQIATVLGPDAKRLPILLTHSGKIFEALGKARLDAPDFFRVRGVSLVQPPQMELILRLRADADADGRLEQLTAELARQQARGETVSGLISSMKADSAGVVREMSSYENLVHELEEFEKNWDQWDALRQVLQSFQGQDETPGMLEGLDKILKNTDPEEASYVQEILKQELDKLITEVDRLQGEIANRIAPPETPTSEFELASEDADKIATLVVRFRSMQRVPSAAYPIGSFNFRDPNMREYLGRMTTTLERVRGEPEAAEERKQLHQMWRDLQKSNELKGNAEFFLLLAVLYLAQERWMQAYDMASQGITFIKQHEGPATNRNENKAAFAELHLVHAGAGRAFVHSVRMDFPATCEAFLQSAIDDCVVALETQHELFPQQIDGRCLRELALILCSAHDPVYGPREALTPILRTFNPEPLLRWVDARVGQDLLDAAGAFAKAAYEQCADDPHAGALFVNTHLYVMTELDRRLLHGSNPAQHEEERIRLAARLRKYKSADPNFLDTLMWHEYVLGESEKTKPHPAAGERRAEAAEMLAQQLDSHSNIRATDYRPNTTQYYQRLVDYHKMRIRKTAGK